MTSVRQDVDDVQASGGCSAKRSGADKNAPPQHPILQIHLFLVLFDRFIPLVTILCIKRRVSCYG